MARELIKDVAIDNALTYAYAKLDKLSEIESFINGSNNVDG